MSRLTVICHAPTAATRGLRFPDDDDIETSADTLRHRVGRIGAHRWLTGPERRATATASALAEGATLDIDQDLRDWDNGRWTGRELAELQRSEPSAVLAWLSDAAAAPHGGESLLGLLARAGDWLDRQAGIEDRTVAVTHPPILRAILVRALDSGAAAFWRIDAQPLCRAELSHDGRRWALRSLVPIRVARNGQGDPGSQT